MSSRPFRSDFVLREQIADATLRAYHVGFEDNKFRLQNLAEVICRVIPEFAFGPHEGTTLDLTQAWDKMREAAQSVYQTDKFKNRGEFGELILHLLLRDFVGSIPLISKIYFKDTDNATVHGFDGVHIVKNPTKKLWLGESKLYTDGKVGVQSLACDLKDHIEKSYLQREFALISKKIDADFPERDHWLQLMDRQQTLETVFKGICIPLVCTYTSSIFKSHSAETHEYIEAFKSECEALKKHFDGSNVKTDVDVVLMLLPIPSKDELVAELDKRLKATGGI
jgi:hypothetical protein